MMLLPVIGLMIGIFLGIESPIIFSPLYSSYVALGILACVDSVMGGLRSMLEDNFHLDIFFSGFLGNAILAVFLVWLGEQLNIQLSFAAVVVFGFRLFQNFALIRRFLLNKNKKKDNI